MLPVLSWRVDQKPIEGVGAVVGKFRLLVYADSFLPHLAKSCDRKMNYQYVTGGMLCVSQFS